MELCFSSTKLLIQRLSLTQLFNTKLTFYETFNYKINTCDVIKNKAFRVILLLYTVNIVKHFASKRTVCYIMEYKHNFFSAFQIMISWICVPLYCLDFKRLKFYLYIQVNVSLFSESKLIVFTSFKKSYCGSNKSESSGIS